MSAEVRALVAHARLEPADQRSAFTAELRAEIRHLTERLLRAWFEQLHRDAGGHRASAMRELFRL
jgi:hypothetical protein